MDSAFAVLICLGSLVLGEKPKLMCSDWQGKLISPGVEYYPKAEDPCYRCYCGEMGFATGCMTVSCAPPSCPMGYRTVTGKCCHFECTEVGDNTTGLTPPKHDVTGKASEDSMTDLGLRLVASTVTTFLILAVLLVLIHRLRQRRLLVALRRYGHRREHLDDSDNISYSPDYFGIQCPPYVDPPPPYTLPKPPYYQHGEQPPPYEEVVENSNESATRDQITTSGNQMGTSRNTTFNNELQTDTSNRYLARESRESNSNSFVSGVTHQFNQNRNNSSVVRENRVGVGCSVRDHSAHCNNSVDPSDGIITTDRHSGIVHFRNSIASNGGQLNITMGVQNRGRNNRNRFSDSQFSVAHSRNAHTRNLNVNQINGLNLEIRTGLQNLRHHGNSIPLQPMRSFKSSVNPGATLSSSSTDIGESSTSAESLESSPNFTPESPDMDREPVVCNENGKQEANEDADITVKQFMDKQFGPFSRVRRYPTTMSQSWTSTQLGSAGMPNFSHSVSLGSFLPNQDICRNNSDDRITSEERVSQMHGSVLSDCKLQDNQLLRSKSEQLKTNGSLKTPPFKGIVRSQTTSSNLPLPQTGYGARVSYVEPDELSRFMNEQRRAKSGDFSHFHHNTCPPDNIDSNVSECSSSSQNSKNMSIRNLDPDKIIVSKRQDLLRELRLSHLLQHPDQPGSQLTSVKVSNHDIDTNKVNKHVSEVQNTGIAISNDAHYPDNSYRKVTRHTQLKTDDRSEEKDESSLNSVPHQTVSDTNSLISNSDSSKNSTPVKTVRNKVKEANRNPIMSKSWHGNHVESYENLPEWMPGTDTLGRNVNTHFDKKVVDKDVSNLFYPPYKPSHDIGVIHNTDVIPSSDMRACAAQMYNYETEDRLLKKSKRKHLHKRHSAGCFPVKRESSVQSNHQSPSRPKLSHKLKSFQIKDRNSGHRCCDSLTDSMKDQCCDKIKKHSFEDFEPDVTESSEMPSLLYSKNIASPPCLVSPHFDHINSPGNCDRAGDRNSLFPSKSQKRRSKSLGRIENVKSPERRAENSSGRRHPRAKKAQLLQSGKSNLLNDDIVRNRNNVAEITEPDFGVTGPARTDSKLI